MPPNQAKAPGPRCRRGPGQNLSTLGNIDGDAIAQKQVSRQINFGSAARAGNGGRKSRDKGDRLERAIVKLFQDHGFGAERVPLSRSAGGSYSGDLSVPLLGRDLTVECKARANGFVQFYSWLEDRDVLIVKADRKDALVILPLRLALEIAAAAERGKGGAP
jgi:Holliday junction resolvase